MEAPKPNDPGESATARPFQAEGPAASGSMNGSVGYLSSSDDWPARARPVSVPIPVPLDVVVAARPVARTLPRALGWRSVGLCLLALLVAMGLQLMAGLAFGIYAGATRQRPDSVYHVLRSAGGFSFLLACAQAPLLFLALWRPRRSSAKTWWRLGLTVPALPVWGYAAFVSAAFLAAVVGAFLARGLGFAVTGALTNELWSGMSPWAAVLFVLFVGLAPGFCEEFFFRGLIQRRLLQVWSPFAAIALSSVLFALMHVQPAQVLFALPIGVWLGALAWRTRSVWPGVVCHAAINIAWNTFFILWTKRVFEDAVAALVVSVVVVLGFLGFAASIVLLERLAASQLPRVRASLPNSPPAPAG